MGILNLEWGVAQVIFGVGKDYQVEHTSKGYTILFRGAHGLERIATNKEIVNKKFIPTDLIVAASPPGNTTLVEVQDNEIPQGAIAYSEGIDKIVNKMRVVPIQFYKKF